MAQTDGKTAARSAVENMLAEHQDVVRESVAFMVRELIEAEVPSSSAPTSASAARTG